MTIGAGLSTSAVNWAAGGLLVTTTGATVFNSANTGVNTVVNVEIEETKRWVDTVGLIQPPPITG